jgi:hypothetical protein
VPERGAVQLWPRKGGIRDRLRENFLEKPANRCDNLEIGARSTAPKKAMPTTRQSIEFLGLYAEIKIVHETHVLAVRE